MMPPDTFEAYAMATGLDVLALQRVFRCAYYSVTRRLGEVMRRQPLMAVLYERQGDKPEEWPEQAAPGSSGPRQWFGRRGSGRNLRACSAAPRAVCPSRTGARPPAHWPSK